MTIRYLKLKQTNWGKDINMKINRNILLGISLVLLGISTGVFLKQIPLTFFFEKPNSKPMSDSSILKRSTPPADSKPSKAFNQATSQVPPIQQFDPARLTRIVLNRRFGMKTASETETVVLDKKDQDWYLSKPVQYLANSKKVSQMLGALSKITIISSSDESQKKLKVLQLDERLGIQVTGFAHEQKLFHIILGVSRNGRTAVRRPGDNKVFQIRGRIRPYFNNTTKDLRSPTITAFDDNSVSRVRFISPQSSFEFFRNETLAEPIYQTSNSKIRNFNVGKARTIAKQLQFLLAKDFVDQNAPDDMTGLHPNAPQVSFDAIDHGEKKTCTLTIGNDLPYTGLTYLQSSTEDQIFLISTHIAALFKSTAADFSLTDAEKKQIEASQKHIDKHHAMHRNHLHH